MKNIFENKMSLERTPNTALIDEKNPLDTSSSVNLISNSILGRGIEDIYSPDASIEMYALGIPLDTQKSSQFSDFSSNRASFEYKGIDFFHEISKFDANRSKPQNLIEKSVKNPSTDLLSLTPNKSSKSISEVSFDENSIPLSQHKEIRDSTIYTNLSSDSSHINTEPVSPHVLEESKRGNFSEISKSKCKQPIANRPAASIRNSTFALTNRIYCMKCNAETFTNVSFQMKDMNIWGSIGFFFTAIKCCGEPRALSRYQDIVHSCKMCGSVVARISTV